MLGGLGDKCCMQVNYFQKTALLIEYKANQYEKFKLFLSMTQQAN